MVGCIYCNSPIGNIRVVIRECLECGASLEYGEVEEVCSLTIEEVCLLSRSDLHLCKSGIGRRV